MKFKYNGTTCRYTTESTPTSKFKIVHKRKHKTYTHVTDDAYIQIPTTRVKRLFIVKSQTAFFFFAKMFSNTYIKLYLYN